MVARDTSGNAVLVPKLEVDNSDVEAPIRGSSSEGEILKRNPHLLDLFTALRPNLEKEGAYSYTTLHSFRFKKDRVFAKLHFRKRHLLLELRVGQNKVDDADFKYWRQGESNWGYVKLHPGQNIPGKVMDWIDLAIAATSQIEASEEDESQ